VADRRDRVKPTPVSVRDAVEDPCGDVSWTHVYACTAGCRPDLAGKPITVNDVGTAAEMCLEFLQDAGRDF
jgi:hypothetical protein